MTKLPPFHHKKEVTFFPGLPLFFVLLKFRKKAPTRPERAEAPSPGRCPGLGAFGPSARS